VEQRAFIYHRSRAPVTANVRCAEMEDRVKRALKTFEEHFSKMDEVTHMVLKGHLIVEEAVNKNIEGGFPNSQYITALNLRFFQKVQLLRAVSGRHHQEPIWDLILALNELRNAIAHSLESPRIQEKTAALRAAYFKTAEGYPKLNEQRNQPDHIIVGAAAALAVGMLLGIGVRGENAVLLAKVLDSLGLEAPK
jgi:hypothetical protein